MIKKTWINQQGRPFDRTIVSQLLSNVEKTPGGRITEDEFVRIWIECEAVLREKVARNDNEVKKALLCIAENVISIGNKIDTVQNAGR